MTSPSRAAAVAVVLACLVAGARADEAFSISGFGSLVAGRVLGGDRQEPLFGYTCPCFIGDYSQGGLYKSTWSVRPESRVGVQGSYAFTPKLSATVQVVARDVDRLKASLEWAYLSYELTPAWTLQVGRKRLPIYYYSDFQDVGYAYTWVRPPTDLYGWEVVNYDGVNATWRGQAGEWALKSNLFGGREDRPDNPMQRIFYETPQDVTWKRILGGDLVASRGAWTARATYIQSRVQQRDRLTGERVTPEPDAPRDSEKQRIYGASVNVDFDPWFVRSEYSVFDRSSYSYKSRAWMVGAGARFGAFTPMLTTTKYRENNAFTPDSVQRDHGWSATLRYELTAGSALKIQYDRFRDVSGPELDFVGNSRALSLALDVVF